MIWVLILLIIIIALPFALEIRRRRMTGSTRGSASGRFVPLSQGVTHYEWHGPAQGPVVVCIHGLTTPSFVWRGMTKSLAVSGYRVLTYDLYGRGYSDRPTGVQDRQFFLQQLTELLAHEGVEDDLTLIGYSMGGAIATCFASAFPGRIRQLVLLAPAGVHKSTDRMRRFIRDTPFAGDWLIRAAYPALLRKGLRAERTLTGSVPNINDMQLAELETRGFVPAILASVRGILAEDLETDHKAIAAAGIPVLAIWGREDDLIPDSSAGQLAEWNRTAQQDVIEGAGHGLTYTHTNEVLRIMRGWWLQKPDD